MSNNDIPSRLTAIPVFDEEKGQAFVQVLDGNNRVGFMEADQAEKCAVYLLGEAIDAHRWGVNVDCSLGGDYEVELTPAQVVHTAAFLLQSSGVVSISNTLNAFMRRYLEYSDEVASQTVVRLYEFHRLQNGEVPESDGD